MTRIRSVALPFLGLSPTSITDIPVAGSRKTCGAQLPWDQRCRKQNSLQLTGIRHGSPPAYMFLTAQTGERRCQCLILRSVYARGHVWFSRSFLGAKTDSLVPPRNFEAVRVSGRSHHYRRREGLGVFVYQRAAQEPYLQHDG